MIDVAREDDDDLVAEAMSWLIDEPNNLREMILTRIAGPAQSDIDRFVENLFLEDI